MQKFTIRNYQTGEIIHEGEAENFRAFVEKNKHHLKEADLSDADLTGANLECANLVWANLNDANLKGADLTNADLINANLEGANLERAYLREANLWGVYLERAYLGGANLRGADLRDAYFGGADLESANLEDSIISIYSKQNILIKLLDSNIEKQDINKILINIGCKTKTIEEWDTWFASDEEYETKRGTFEFRQIQAMYEAYKAYIVKLWS